ncbi:hypothetical protein [Deinococcus arcticus]|uniref:Uncharacterized protein n=1 Tax=Deinococcus arcticus TaxID=2136176 RepID=A0A2T3W6E0_9DEIO|nr:hypothetical protein [Deinococcus arcticus]PTA67323.1 hypothetical protein C8263_13570 [Deinococcus arcticus]
MNGSETAEQVGKVRAASLAQRRRVSEMRARQHVGAAGWAQSSALDAIVRAGREGLAATDALRQVMHLTTEQLRALPLSDAAGEQATQARALQGLLESSEAQLTAAQALDALVCEALTDVADTPLEEMNVQRLKDIHARVREQVAALDTLVHAAQVQAQTLEQVSQLSRVSTEFHEKVAGLGQLSAQEEAQALGETGQQVVSRLSELDDAPPAQMAALTRIGEAVADGLTDTAAPPAEQAQALQDLAELMDEKAREVRQS